MKIVREHIEFQRGQEPKHAMSIGKVKLIHDWMNEGGVGIKNFEINDDYSIDLFMPWTMNQSRPDLFPDGRFPEYIRFRSSKDFDIDDCGIEHLEGCPSFVDGYFSCQMNGIKNLDGMPYEVSGSVYIMGNEGNFTEEQIRAKCNVGKDVETDDTPEP